jgi:hypothetical protein
MAAILIEYARFREVQERRARMVEDIEPTQAADPPATKTVADVARVARRSEHDERASRGTDA